jgi:hypothetical protein
VSFPYPIDAWLAVDKSREEVRQAYAGKDRIFFQFWVEDFSTSVQANWDTVEVIGRSHPYHIYGSTGAKEIDIKFQFFAEGNRTASIRQAIDDEVMSNIRFLESLAYPIRTFEGLVSRPATCILKIGDIITERVILEGGANPTYMGPWLDQPLLPYQAEMDCTFVTVPLHGHTASGVLNPHPASSLGGASRAAHAGPQ